jgi:regulator of sigma D
MFFDWFKNKKAPPPAELPKPAAEKPRKRSAIEYNPKLIAILQHEHRDLLREYTGMIEALGAGNYARIGELLDNFDEGLRAHLAREHVELYIYLEYILAKDTASFQQMHELRTEMDHISTAVMTFLNQYQNTQVNAQNSQVFRQELEAIGKVLGERIKREEEKLYSLYRRA